MTRAERMAQLKAIVEEQRNQIDRLDRALHDLGEKYKGSRDQYLAEITRSHKELGEARAEVESVAQRARRGALRPHSRARGEAMTPEIRLLLAGMALGFIVLLSLEAIAALLWLSRVDSEVAERHERLGGYTREGR
jgi:hypothetical protein